jgi:hypothetical protein
MLRGFLCVFRVPFLEQGDDVGCAGCHAGEVKIRFAELDLLTEASVIPKGAVLAVLVEFLSDCTIIPADGRVLFRTSRQVLRSSTMQQLQPFDLESVRFSGGFWGVRCETNRMKTIPVLHKFNEETGCADVLAFGRSHYARGVP